MPRIDEEQTTNEDKTLSSTSIQTQTAEVDRDGEITIEAQTGPQDTDAQNYSSSEDEAAVQEQPELTVEYYTISSNDKFSPNELGVDEIGNPMFYRALMDGDVHELLKHLSHDKNSEATTESDNSESEHPNDSSLNEYDSDKLQQLNKRMTNNAMRTSLHMACMGIGFEYFNTVMTLIMLGAKLNIADSLGRLPLHMAANAGDIEIIEHIATQPGMRSLFDTIDLDGRTVVHAICMPALSEYRKVSGEYLYNALSKLLQIIAIDIYEQQILLNRNDNYGITPLQYAKYYELEPILEYARSIDINTEEIIAPSSDNEGVRFDYHGRLPIHRMIVDSGNPRMRDISEVQLHAALETPNAANDLGAINRQYGNFNALNYAAKYGSPGALKQLLDHESLNLVIINQVDMQDRTAMHHAASRAYIEIIAGLVNDGRFSVNKSDIHGDTPLHKFASSPDADLENGGKEIIDLFVSKDVDLDAINNSGHTPATLAKSLGNNKICEYLLDVQLLAFVGTPDTKLTQENKELIDSLIAAGANVFLENSDGYSVKDVALQVGNNEIAAYLSEIMTCLNDLGDTPPNLNANAPGGYRLEAYTIDSSNDDEMSDKESIASSSAASEGYVADGKEFAAAALRFSVEHISSTTSISDNKRTHAQSTEYVSDADSQQERKKYKAAPSSPQ